MGTIIGLGAGREVAMVGLRPAPLRPLGVAEILDGAVRLVRRNARGALALTIPFAIVRSALGAWLAYAAIGSDSASTVAAIGALLLGSLFGTVLTGVLSPMFSADLLGTRLTGYESLKRVGHRLWSLAALGVAVTVVESAGVALFGVPGIWLWGIWAVVSPALVLEGTGMGQAFRRSRDLVRGTFWRTWGTRALGWVLTSVLGVLITLPFQLLAAVISNADPLDTTASVSHPGLYVTILAIGAIISNALLMPISAGIDILIYSDLRMRKEGMDIVLGMPPDPAATGATRPAVTAW
jgi:hypothetical protein